MLGKLAISIGGGVLTYYYIASSMGGFTTDEYIAATDDTKKLLSSEIVPAAIAFLLCFATSSIFFYSYQMAIGSPARRLAAQLTRPAPPRDPLATLLSDRRARAHLLLRFVQRAAFALRGEEAISR
jgi:hypothetical protein